MNKKDITRLILWNDDIVEIEMNIEDFLTMQTEDKSNWVTEFYVSKLQRSVTYSNIKDKQGKTQFLSIEAPKNEPTQAERDKGLAIARNLLKKAWVNKEKRFIERRNEILEDLRKREVALGLETTLEKIENYNRNNLK